MKKTLYVFIALLMFAVKPVLAEGIPADKKVLIDQLLAQTGQSAVAISKQFSTIFIQQMTAILKKSQPSINPKAFDYMTEEVHAVLNEEIKVNGGFFELIYPIYNKHLSKQELEELVAFNKTPLGQKMNKVLPQITQEAMIAGQTFGKSLSPKIQQRIVARFEKEGIELKK